MNIWAETLLKTGSTLPKSIRSIVKGTTKEIIKNKVGNPTLNPHTWRGLLFVSVFYRISSPNNTKHQ